MTEKFTHLHVHTQYSLLDGASKIDLLLARAKKLGMDSIAITDHGTVQAFPKARDAGKGKIKILYGVEAYFVNDVDDRVVVHGETEYMSRSRGLTAASAEVFTI